ncbi:MAG: cytochrome c biogenesis protein DipZ [Microgenomates group bacterium]
MIVLILFAFIAGFVTILSPCVLPILPIVLSGGIGGGKKRPLGIVLGFIISFTFFTLFLSSLVTLFKISPDTLRLASVIIIFGLGMSILIPQFQLFIERMFAKVSNKVAVKNSGDGFGAGVLLGISLGLVWTPCVGPILASVITLAASNALTTSSLLITLAYSIGTAIPLLLITYGGRALLQKVPLLVNNTIHIQKSFGILMMVVSIGIFFNIDRSFQTYILDVFPNYGTNLTRFEDNELVKKQLEGMKKAPSLLKLDGAPEFISGQWLNSNPLSMSSLKGKVVLVDFWTYTCINCIRTLPTLTSWHTKYKDKGLVIVGIHTPEFAFERSKENVESALKMYGISYPVLQDNDYENWNAYSNRYWPAKYLIDASGRIRYTHFGEGAYEETEKKIQELLLENGVNQLDSIQEEKTQGTLFQGRTPELYLGSNRTEGRVEVIDDMPLHTYVLSGQWTITDEYARSSPDSSLTLHFQGNEVNLVMSPLKKGDRVKVYLDDKVVDETLSGTDVRNGIVTLDMERLYNIIRLPKHSRSSILRLEFLDGATECYAFTFG